MSTMPQRSPANKTRPALATINAAVQLAAAKTGVPAIRIRSDDRTRKAAHARWLAWRQLHEIDGFGLAPIARAWGCDHTSIIHAKRKGWGQPKPCANT